MRKRVILFVSLLSFALSSYLSHNALSEAVTKKSWAEMVGDWRVTGQPKRGSSAGAWVAVSKVEWASVEKPLAESKKRELSLVIKGGPRASTVRFRQDDHGDVILMEVTQNDWVTVFRAPAAGGKDNKTFQSENAGPKGFERWTFQQKSRDRWMILVEHSKTGTADWARDVELGITRIGTTISLGDGQPRCVVTGGLGEMVVMIGGKSYYVCCSGCREALLDDPDAFIKGGAGLNKEKSVQP